MGPVQSPRQRLRNRYHDDNCQYSDDQYLNIMIGGVQNSSQLILFLVNVQHRTIELNFGPGLENH